MRRLLFSLLFLGWAPLVWSQDFPSGPFHAFRLKLALPTPFQDEALSRSSQNRALELARTGVLSHNDEQGRGPGIQMAAEGVLPGEFGEVLGAGADADEVWRAWLASPAHRAILADPNWSAWGWGQAQYRNSTIYVLRFRGP